MSIRQKTEPTRLPDFRNLGVMLRIMLVVNFLVFCAALVRNPNLSSFLVELIEMAALVEPTLIACLLIFSALASKLHRLSYTGGLLAVGSIASIIATLVYRLFTPLIDGGAFTTLRPALLGMLSAVVVMIYFDLRSRAFSPAFAQGRLMALTARIRPHFLFNSLNAILGVIRTDPKRAELAIEEMCDLFRALMADNRELVPLSDEVALCRQYLDLERLRLGERLQVTWDINGCPKNAFVPPLMLQPLLENAVYYGVEPSSQPAEVVISARCRGDEIRIEITNPAHETTERSTGNHMALDNIRERLMLFFDLEAKFETKVVEGIFHAYIRIPYRQKGTR